MIHRESCNPYIEISTTYNPPPMLTPALPQCLRKQCLHASTSVNLLTREKVFSLDLVAHTSPSQPFARLVPVVSQ